MGWTLWQCPQRLLYNQWLSHWMPSASSVEPGTWLSPNDWRGVESHQANVHWESHRIGCNPCLHGQGWWPCPAFLDLPPLSVLLGPRATPLRVHRRHNRPHLQVQRKPAFLQQSSWYLLSLYCWLGLSPRAAQQPPSPSGARSPPWGLISTDAFLVLHVNARKC